MTKRNSNTIERPKGGNPYEPSGGKPSNHKSKLAKSENGVPRERMNIAENATHATKPSTLVRMGQLRALITLGALEPGDEVENRKIVKEALQQRGMVLFRISGQIYDVGEQRYKSFKGATIHFRFYDGESVEDAWRRIQGVFENGK